MRRVARSLLALRRAAFAGLVGVLFLAGLASSAHAAADDRAHAAEASSAPPTRGAQTSASLPREGLRRVEISRAPSFSPYVRVVSAWSRQGSWWIATTEAHWPPPWPKLSASGLMEQGDTRALATRIHLALAAALPIRCGAEAPALRRGQAIIRVEFDTAEGLDTRCFSLDEEPYTGRHDDALTQLFELAPPVEAVDRWTHPFWLQDESGVLRIELRGTATLHVDAISLGRVNGVLTLRLPVGRRELTLIPANGAESRTETVHLQSHRVTVLRVSVEDGAGLRPPSWEQPRSGR